MGDIELLQNVTFRISDPGTSKHCCFVVVERFSNCHCLYYRHSVQPCATFLSNPRKHKVHERVVLVGYACPKHSEDYRESEQGGEITASSQLV